MEIERLRTASGGYTKADLAKLGVPWPPPKGWLKRLKAQLPQYDAERLTRENRERQQKHHGKKAKRKARLKASKHTQPQQPKPMKRPAKKQPKISVYGTSRWKRLRYEVLCEQGSTCQICGASPKDGAVMNVDHIYLLHSHPHLAFEKSNLRCTCASCNWGKGERQPGQFEQVMEAEFSIPWDRFEKF